MIKNKITLKQLEAFASVVDQGTFRAAAQALGTTQPNISARINALENTLGVVILYRDAGSVRLTEKGAELLEKARGTLWAAESFLEEAGRQDLINERMRLGVTELVACTWLQGFLRRLKLEYPKVRVELQVDLSVHIEQALSEGKLDLAIHNAPQQSPIQGAERLADRPYVWVANDKLSKELGEEPQLVEVFQHPVLMHAKHTQAARELQSMSLERGLPAEQIVHSSALSACLPMAVDGMGVALLPEALLTQQLESGSLQKLMCSWLPEPLAFFARYDATRAPNFVVRAAQMAIDASNDVEG